MVTGAASSEAALLLIDAHEGVQEQSRRHGYLLHLLGVQQVAVLVNKMDLVGYSADRFGEVAEDYRAYLARSRRRRPPASSRSPPARATTWSSTRRPMPWYQGPTVLQALDAFEYTELPTERPLRVPVQDVYKFDQRRIIAGRIESGHARGSATRWCSRPRTRPRRSRHRGLARAARRRSWRRPGQSDRRHARPSRSSSSAARS